MSPGHLRPAGWGTRVPRASGDEPRLLIESLERRLCSPRERG